MRRPHWPERWEERRGRIYYRPREHEKPRFDGRSIYLLGDTEAEAFRTYYARIDSADSVPRTIGAAMDLYIASERFQRLKPKTRDDYTKILGGPLRAVFGQTQPGDFLPTYGYRYLRERPAVAGNREWSVMVNVMDLCVERGALVRNLAREVRKSPEQKRDRYVTDAELTAFLAVASARIRAYVRLKLLTGLRQGQMLGLRLSDWRDGELHAPGAKGGRANVYHGDGLADAVKEVIATHHGDRIRSLYLFAPRQGGQYTSDGFRAIWQRAMARHVAAEGVHFTEHDLRAKVASDSASVQDAQARLGHVDASITRRVYVRKPQSVEVLKR